MDGKQLAKLETALKGIAVKITRDSLLRDELVQEGLIAIWSKLKKAGDYNEAYLRQHAKHRMINYLALGRSLDNGFHKTTRVELVNANTGETIDLPHPEDTMQGLYARELIDLIDKHTFGITNKVFHMLCDGYNETEIAGKLKTSQKNVSRERAVVQDLVKKFYNSGRIALHKIRDKSCKKGQLWFSLLDPLKTPSP